MSSPSQDGSGTSLSPRTQFVLTVVLMLFGAGLLWWPIPPMYKTLYGSWLASDWFNLAAMGILWVCLTGLAIGLVLHPLGRVPILKWIVWVCFLPLFLVNHVAPLVALVYTLVFLIAIPFAVTRMLKNLGILPDCAESPFLYLALLLLSFVYTYWGGRITEFVVCRWWKIRQDCSRLRELLRVDLVRIYVLATLAFVFTAANLEKLSGTILTSAIWWEVYKEIILAVLLTYVAFDRAMVAWIDSRKATR